VNRIPQGRALLYCLVAGVLPVILIVSYYFLCATEQVELGTRLQSLCTMAQQKRLREMSNKEVRRRYSLRDHFYIDKHIETIAPLAKEKERLQSLTAQNFHPEEDKLKRRSDFLSSNQNRLSFVDGSVKNYGSFQEVEETLAHPVEVDLDDLKTILAAIEETPLSSQEASEVRPHMFITECKLEKKNGPLQDVLLLQLKILKREYTK
jgi:hypothetical protein